MLNVPLSITRNITSHSMKNLAFHSLPRWKIDILPILTTYLTVCIFSYVGRMYFLTCFTTSSCPLQGSSNALSSSITRPAVARPPARRLPTPQVAAVPSNSAPPGADAEHQTHRTHTQQNGVAEDDIFSPLREGTVFIVDWSDTAEIRFGFAVRSPWFWVTGYCTQWRIQGQFS